MLDEQLYGAARWADYDDIAERYSYNPETDFFLGRNPFDFNQAIGFNDNTHVFLCAGTRGGKGRSIIVNNLLQWRGSIVSIDPKGENASICAPRRAGGNKFCKGLGQKTYVLDPYRRAQVPEELRASCNPMDMLDANSGSLLTTCELMAEAMRIMQDGGESESWSKDAVQITALVIAHVKTSPHVPDNQRDLIKVRDYLVEGDQAGVEAYETANRAELERAAAEGGEPNLIPVPDPYELLFEEMQENPAQRGAVARRARGLMNLMRKNERQWGSLIQNARTETNFIDDLQMQEQLLSSSEGGRSFKISDLQDDPNGISVFICLPDNPDHPAIRWQKGLLALIFDHMQQNQLPPATGKQVLMVLDEFAAMGRVPRIAHGMTSISGAGIKLFIIVTDIAPLKDNYNARYSSFLAGCGLQIWFRILDHETGELLEKRLGETQIVLTARGLSRGKTKGTSRTVTDGETVGENESEAEGRSDGESRSVSSGHTRGHNMSVSVSDSQNWNRSEGTSRARTRGQSATWQHADTLTHGSNRSSGSSSHLNFTRDGFFGGWVKSTNDGRGSNSSTGTNRSRSRSDSRGGSTNDSSTITHSANQSVGGGRTETQQEGTNESTTNTQSKSNTTTLSRTYTQGRSRQKSHSEAFGESESETLTVSLQENIFKRPLMTLPEMEEYLYGEEVRDHPSYPGFALVKMGKERAFLVRKCHYDEDPLFEGLFTPHYAHRDHFLPFSQQRLVGGQYTPAHFLPIRLPKIVQETAARIDVDLKVATDEWFDEGQEILSWEGAHLDGNHQTLQQARKPLPVIKQDLNAPEPYKHPKVTLKDRVGDPARDVFPVKAPADGKVIDVALTPAYREDGDIVLVRAERSLSDADRAAFEQSAFEQIIAYLEQHGATEDEIKRMRKALNARYRQEWEAHQAELARHERERQEAEEEAQRKRELQEAQARQEAARRAREALEHAIAEEEKVYRSVYAIITAFFLVIVPTAYIGGNTYDAAFHHDLFRASNIYSNKLIITWGWKDKTDPVCWGGERDKTDLLLLRYYRCSVKTGEAYSHPRNGARLVGLAFTKPLFFMIPILLACMLFFKFNTERYQFQEFGKQFEIAMDGAASVAWLVFVKFRTAGVIWVAILIAAVWQFQVTAASAF